MKRMERFHQNREGLKKWPNESSKNFGAELRKSYRFLKERSKSYDDDEWETQKDSGNFNDEDDEDDEDEEEEEGRGGKVTFKPFDYSLPRSAMETLDRRISLSSDQLDTLRRCRRHNRDPNGGNQFRSRSASRNKLLNTDKKAPETEEKKKINFNLLSKMNPESPPEKKNRAKVAGQNRKTRKTALDIFLEDEGPYSRRLYGPPPDKDQNNWAKKGSNIKAHNNEEPSTKDDEHQEPQPLQKQQILPYPDDEKMVLQRGLLWQQRDKFFSRWKERFFILTKDYLNCFKKGSSRLTEMGGFIFKLKLADIEAVDLLDKRGYLTICITVLKDGKMYLRRPEGIKEWFISLQNNIFESKRKKRFWTKRQISDSPGLEQWLLTRQKLVTQTRSPKASSSPNISTPDAYYHASEQYHCQKDEKSDRIKQTTTNNATTTVNNPRGINRLLLVNELISKENVSDNHKKFKKKINERDSGNDSGHNSINTMSDSSPSEDNLSSTTKSPNANHKAKLPSNPVEADTSSKVLMRFKDMSSIGNSKTVYRRTYAYGQHQTISAK